jgi:hypothetical protein
VRRSPWSRGLALALAVSVTGCYSYIPSEPAAVPPGERVRVYVTREALAGLGEIPVQSGGPVLNGTLVRAEPANLVVRLPVATRQTGFNIEVLGQDVFIPSDQVLQLERREMNGPMTALLTVGGTAAIAGLVVMIISGARGGEQRPPGDGGVELVPRGVGAVR